jgi:hypothetical protein
MVAFVASTFSESFLISVILCCWCLSGTDCFHHPLFQRGKQELANNIICTPRADLPPGANGVPGMGAVGGKDQAKLIGMGASADSKPPSLAGVEKFIRAKVAAEQAKNEHTGGTGAASLPEARAPAAPLSIVKEEDDDDADDLSEDDVDSPSM